MGGPGTYAGDTGVFWIGSGLAIVAAFIAYFFAPDIKVDIMKDEDLAVSLSRFRGVGGHREKGEKGQEQRLNQGQGAM